ncbi:MAG: chemotaxis protein CheA [gamma proteobacterium symbiont of Taylorina sp.]|nr:chemotaxis protein CheA [gamma proteobacterium symbiont of Taylorina sp.]
MEIDENVQIFISEGEELLQDMEDSLLELEESDDPEVLNTIFRAAHTIKGSAGLFGLDHIIHFTHVVENVLDDMRNCMIPTSSELITVLMRSRDHIVSLLEGIVDDDEGNKEEEAELIQLLKAFQGTVADELVAAADSNEVESSAEPLAEDGEVSAEGEHSLTDHYHISLRLGEDTFRQGFDPASMFRQLSDLGEIKETVFIPQTLPSLDDLDPESCYLGWEIAIHSDFRKEKISEIFQYLDGCHLSILAPQSHFSEYKHLIEQLPEEEMALGQILLQTGSLTQGELQRVLNQQKENIESGELESENRTGDLLVENQVVQKEVVEEALNKQTKVREQKQKALSFVKVDSEKLDKLINLVGELVINGAKLNMITENIADEELNETMEGMTMSLEDLREIALGLRMVPIGTTFNRFHRVIRDTSKDLNKEINLEIYGADTELDKTVIEKIGDPLMHLIRNSMDHGIEMPDDRQLAGKSREGTITLQAQHEAGYITIQIKDDGKGLNPEMLLEKAIEKGIVKDNQKLSKQECLNLIFAAGFSTATEISNISGRGVGMDVVRRNIESLRGSVYIDSELGVGTTITIQLPLTLAIIDGFNVSIDSEFYIFPLDMVHECLTLTPSQIEEASVHNYITLREEVLPIVHLKEYFDVEQSEQYNETYMVHKGRERHNIVVVEFANKKVGLIVDELLGEVQAVIKPLGRVFKGLSGFAGFTILGSGMVALVLDIPSLIKEVVGNEHKHFDSLKQKSVASRGNRVVH